MSILDTFYILFKTDADKAAEDIKKVDGASDQAEQGLKKVDKAASSVGSSFVAMAKQIAAPLLALASVGGAISIAMERAAAVRELDQFSSKLNSSISDVDAFQRAVKGMGGDTAAALDSLVKIGEQVNDAFSDKESGIAKDFKEWGVSFKDAKGQALGASDAMLVLAGNLEKVSRAEALSRIKKLGIEDAATIDLILKGRAALEERIRAEKELGVVTEDQARQTREYYAEMGRAQNALTSIGNIILSAVLPAFTKLVGVFADVIVWVKNNRTLVEGFFVGLAGVITAVYLPAITAAAAATLTALAPFIAVGAAIAAVGAAFALAYEDVVAFMNGQPSLIGALAERYEWFAKIVEGVGTVFKTLKAGGAAALEGLSVAVSTAIDWAQRYAEAWLEFWSQFKPIADALKEYFSAVSELVSAVVDRVTQGLTPAITAFATAASEAFARFLQDIKPITDAVATAAAAIKEGFAGAFNYVMGIWDSTIGLIAGKISALAGSIRGFADYIRGGTATLPEAQAANDNARAAGSAGATMGGLIGTARAQAAMNAAAGAPINGQTAQSIGAAGATVNNTSSVSVGNVTVNTQATDAKGVAAAVKGELRRQLSNTATQLDDGVRN